MTDYKPTPLMIAWHDALLEPGRKQTTGRLGRIDEEGQVSNCCLGVLAEVAGNTATEYEYLGQTTGSLVYNGPTASDDHVMPSKVLTALALGQDPDGHLVGQTSGDIEMGVDFDGLLVTGSELNDDFGWTFAEIAEQIKTVYIDGTGNPRDYPIENLSRGCSEEDCEC